MLVIAIVFAVVKTEFIVLLLGYGIGDSIIFCLAVVQALWMVFTTALGAACSAWVYRRFSSAILSTTVNPTENHVNPATP